MYTRIIEKEDIRDFMNSLFKGENFDFLRLRSCEVVTLIKYSLDGAINKEWREEEEEYFISWKDIKPFVTELIKGKKPPKTLKIIFSYPENELSIVHKNAAALFLNISFLGERVEITGGSSQKEFVLNNGVETAWSDKIEEILNTVKEKGLYE